MDANVTMQLSSACTMNLLNETSASRESVTLLWATTVTSLSTGAEIASSGLSMFRQSATLQLTASSPSAAMVSSALAAGLNVARSCTAYGVETSIDALLTE